MAGFQLQRLGTWPWSRSRRNTPGDRGVREPNPALFVANGGIFIQSPACCAR